MAKFQHFLLFLSVLIIFASCSIAQKAKPASQNATTSALNATTTSTTTTTTTTTAKPGAKAAKPKPTKKPSPTTTLSTTASSTTTTTEEEAEEELSTTPAEDEEEEEQTVTTKNPKNKKPAQLQAKPLDKKKSGEMTQKPSKSNRTAAPATPLDMYSEFYRLDVEKAKQLPQADDTAVKLQDVYVPVTLYDKPYQDVYVDNNGIITLGSSIAQFQALQFPLPYAAIAPLYQDVDTRGEGFVRYQVVTKRDQLAQQQLEQQRQQQQQQQSGGSREDASVNIENPLERASETLQHFFPRSAQNFEPEQVIVAQWEEVGYYSERTDKLNTYQAIVISDNADTYVIFLYGQLEWDASDSKLGQPRMPAQAGFVGDRGYAYIIKEYGKPLEKLARGTNVGKPGMYVFHVGRVAQNGGQVRGPEIATNSPDQDFTAYPSESRYGPSPYGGSNDGAREQQLEQQQRRQQHQQQHAAGAQPSYDDYYGEQVDEYERRRQQEAERLRQEQQQPQADPYEQQRREYYEQQAQRERSNPTQAGIYPVVGAQQPQQTDQYGRPLPSYYGGAQPPVEQVNNNHDREAARNNNNNNRYSDNGNRQPAEGRPVYDERLYEQQQLQQQQRYQGPNDGTCSPQDKTKCDVKAGVCENGCCRCQDGLRGNGVVCINPSEPLRMHGTFSGTLNGEPINTATIFTHALLNEGRIYGALGDVDLAIGSRLTALLPTVATLGWLAALPPSGGVDNGQKDSPPNGIDMAGLEFLSNMQLKFTSGESATVRTTFNGHDQDRDVVARVNIEFDGELPDITNKTTQLSSDDVRITYLKISPGTYKAEWTMPLNDESSFNNGGDALPQFNVSVIETITYRECPQLSEQDAPTEVDVVLERPYGLWQNDSKASRFSVSARLYDARQQQQHQQQLQNQHRQQQETSYTPHYSEGFYGQGSQYGGAAGEQSAPDEQPPYAAGGYDPYYDAAQRERQREEDRRREEQEASGNSGGGSAAGGREHVGHGSTAVVHLNGAGSGSSEPVPNESATNPCERLPMPEQAVCTVQEGQPRYDCVPGLRVAEWLPYGDAAYKPRCEDVDECLYGQDNCAEEADCQNTVGSFTCACKPGFSGDGVQCSPGTNGAAAQPPAAASRPDDADRQQPGIYPVVPYQPAPSPVVTECARLQCAAEATCIMNPEYSKPECRCNPGFRGDGYVCMPENPQDASCLDNRGLCDPNADCTAEGRCVCREGYAGDGTICIDGDEQCNIQNNCHANAKCTYNSLDGTYLCKCLPGYAGNGYECHGESQPATLDPNDCSRFTTICDVNAQCILDRTENAYRCRCYPGYTGNGIMCNRAQEDEENCCLNPQMCHSNAACRPTSAGNYVCKCLGNYFGDGTRNCSPAPRGGFIVFTQGQAVMRKYVDANAVDPGEEVISLRGQTAVGIAVDCRQSYVYWSDIRTNTIQRVNYKDKSNKGTVFDKEIGSPEGMVIDPVSRNIFWTDSQRDHVVVANIDRPEAGGKVIVSGNLTNPRGIAILPQRGYVFYTDWNRQDPKIERCDMDGSNRRVLFDRNSPIGLQLPNAVAVCPITERIYWADAGTHKIMCADLDGQDPQVVYDQARYPFSMALLDNTLYWSDWEKNKIMYVSKNGGQAKELDRPLTASGRVYGIAAVPDVCPNSLNSRCTDSSTLCRFICLPLPQGRDECVCPDGIDPAECQQQSAAPYYQR